MTYFIRQEWGDTEGPMTLEAAFDRIRHIYQDDDPDLGKVELWRMPDP